MRVTITVLDWQGDSFGSYAEDGLSDAWQVNYFGINSSAAVAAADPDQDGQDNAFEYLSGADRDRCEFPVSGTDEQWGSRTGAQLQPFSLKVERIAFCMPQI